MTKHKSKKHHKRHGKHHRKTKAYHKTYWPFLPLLLLIVGMFVFTTLRTTQLGAVLSFATEMSAQTLLAESNEQRAKHDRQALSLNAELSEAARMKALDMAERNYWSHDTPDGEPPWIFIEEAGYNYMKAGENLAYGFMTSQQTVNGWMNSPSHRDNLLDPSFSEVGFGFVNAVNFQSSDEETIVVALYAQPLHPTIADADDTDNHQITASVAQNEADIVTAQQPPVRGSDTAQGVTRLESMISSNFAWMSFSLGIMSGASAVGLFVSHGIRMRTLLRRGEEFIAHHPLLDISLVLLLALMAYLASHTGTIL